MKVRKPRRRRHRSNTYYGSAYGTGKRKRFSRRLKVGLYVLAVFIFGLMVCVATIGLGSAVKARTILFIPTGAGYAQVQDSLRASGNVQMLKFEVLSRIKGYPETVKPGRYVLDRGVTALAVVNKLSGYRISKKKMGCEGCPSASKATHLPSPTCRPNQNLPG